MPRQFRNSFNSGVLDPKLAARADLEQWRSGLLTGTNFMLLPHGGAIRRPGMKFVREVPQPGRLSRFRFNLEAQYVLHWRTGEVAIFDSDGDLITRVTTPYALGDLPELYLRAQTADTLVVFHPDHAPHRLLRSALKVSHPIRTNMTNPDIVRVYQPEHDLFTGDFVGLSGLTDVGGIDADDVLNQPHEVIAVDGNLGANPLSVTLGSKTVVLELGTDFDFGFRDRIEVAGLVTVASIPAQQLNRVHTLTAASGTTVSFDVEIEASATTTGGGSNGTWRSRSFYEIDIAPDEATSATNGGGANGRAWTFHTLEPNEERAVALEGLPQFDYEDALSPDPKREVQKLTFTDFVEGDSYQLVVSIAGGVVINKDNGEPIFATTTIRTKFIDWSDVPEVNTARLSSAINDAVPNAEDVVSVEYVTSSSPEEYKITFVNAVDYNDIQVFKIRDSTGSATIDVEALVEGGSREEDVISDVRGWPAGGLFFGRRLFMFGITSRPSTILGSQIEDFFNFKTGQGLDSEAIDATGEFDPARHLVGERALFLLTSGSEVQVSGGGSDEAITPGNINLRVQGRYGSTAVPPVSVAGRPMYVDSIGRAIRQLGIAETSPSGTLESKDISILSQHLQTGPAQMEVWRNRDGDFLFVAQDDGTAAVLSINVDQGVAGWTKFTTEGSFIEFAEVGGKMFAIVSREIDGGTVYNLEVFDFDTYTDSAKHTVSMDGDTSSGGFEHLEGATVQVRGDSVTLEDVEVDSGVVEFLTGDVPVEVDDVEVGLAIPEPTLSPCPPSVEQFTSIARVAVDLYQSRAVYVNGFRLRDYLPGEAVPATGLAPAITGFRAIQVRGWGDRSTITVTAPEPQPCHIRAIDFEVV